MARVLLSAYACEPGRGSEPGVGWNWAVELTRLGHEVTVITRAANRKTIESEAARPGLSFVYYDLPHWLQGRRRSTAVKAVYYVLWQWFAVRRVRELFPVLPFDLVHHVTYVSARFPSFMGSLGIPFWFGPVSGGEAVPAPLRPGFSAGQRCRERLRDISNGLVPMDPLMRRTFRRADRIFVTRDSLRLIPRCFRGKSTVQLAIGTSKQEATAAACRRRTPSDLRLLYVGRLLEWKGLDIVLHSLSRLKKAHPGLSLTIVGDGPARSRLQFLAEELGVTDNVHWAGWKPHALLPPYYRAADMFVFPSLRDSGGTAVLEALSCALPVLCTDLGGPGIIVDRTCGRVIVTEGHEREHVIEDVASALIELLTVPDVLASLSYGARARAHQFRFENLVRSVYATVATKARA